jgi:hypothetical protein
VQTLLRSWLVWLLVLALPVQGVAAMRAQHCAPTQERLQTAVSAAPGPHAAQPHAADGHHAAHAHAVAAAHESASDPASAGLPDTGGAKCSACAACCPVLGLPTRVLDLLPGLTSSTTMELRRIRVDSFVPGGLDRPPRPDLA